MDLWDVTKVLWRRRWIALPMLLVSALVAFYVVSTVRSDYQATGHLTLLPPSQQRAVDPKATKTPQTVSPWNVYSLADALVIYAGRADVKREFATAGFSEEFTVTIGGTQLPIVEAEVVAPSPEKARATLDRLIDLLGQQLKRLQAPFGVEGGEAITAEVLDSGQNIEVLSSAKKRMLIVVVAIGLVLTVSICLGVDALRRRATAAGPPAPRSGGSRGKPPAGDQDDDPVQSLLIRRPGAPGERSQPAPAWPWSAPPTAAGQAAGRPDPWSGRGPSGGPEAAPRAATDEATTVLDYRLSKRDGAPASATGGPALPRDKSSVLPFAGPDRMSRPAARGDEGPHGADRR
ncbi:hypothetical protein GCE86_05485 [Micromonospora terminaliae]|uniref:Polysaccharide chain length determinant N-terminal domain-containing protein n=1 Tax=Micromonospora terminaliae TaxID=1914461 RepID=A0AAJ2ZI85_9ACTN|nr:hypothetical protein [Micromonospora terminaliae]NES30522.1 hypothetical protein [Micromonospora terminaliae]QGL46557.1 hypothetical protein GCE86_05485 [Micromonospora terminaliae]